MAGVEEKEVWETHVYQIEENDPVHGGANGVTNKPIKHLANRTLYLRKLLTEAGQRIEPKKITATTKNSNDLTGHTHEIDLASLTTKGLVQLTNDTGLDSESLALTAKGAKALAQQIAQNKLAVDNGFIQNSKKSSTVNSTSNDTVATSSAVKAAYDKGVTAQSAADNAKTAADNAQATANAKQSPATTLAGYGIKNGVASENTSEYGGNNIRIGWARTSPFGAYLLVDNTNQGKLLTSSEVTEDSASETLVRRDSSGDIHTRLYRATYQDESRITGAIAFRVNNSTDNYTRYCNSPSAVRNWLGINDIATHSITRKTYNKTIAGTRSGYTTKTAAVSGEVITHPDGTIEQYFKVSAASVYWFTDEPTSKAGDRGITFNMPLWTAMPNKILYATVQLCRPAANNVTYYAEAGEWVGAWSMKEQGTAKNAVYFDFRRISGDSNEQIDIYIKVEGY